MVSALFYAKASFILGLTNVLGLFLVLISCRCMLVNWRLNKLAQSKIFMKIYNYHCYYWYFLILSVLGHATLAIITFGSPF